MASKKCNNLFVKSGIDTLDFLEYFCRIFYDGTDDTAAIIKTFVTDKFFKRALVEQSLDAEYSKHVFELFSDIYNFIPEYPNVDYNDLENFVNYHRSTISPYAIERGLTEEQCFRHEVFLFNTENVCLEKYPTLCNYFLLNNKIRKLVEAGCIIFDYEYPSLKGDYTVFVSRDKDGKINNLCFRTHADTSKVGFKYLFACGSKSTFGLDKIDPTKKTFVVEGVFDAIAGLEQGWNAIGLGSTKVSVFQQASLKHIPNKILMLDSDITGQKRQSTKYDGFLSVSIPDTYKDPFEYFVNGIDIFELVGNS